FFEHIALSFLKLIISHQEFFPNHPLYPQKHGTDACEDIFGWIRILFLKFTILEAFQLEPKIFTVVNNIMKNKVSMPKFEHIHSSYYFSFEEDTHNNPEVLANSSIFPTNAQIDSILPIAKKQAGALI
ncbi:hypothetical protein CROQUDRAFT_36600, partial [Cronartium quercuum f. sp. fusiforme G11]